MDSITRGNLINKGSISNVGVQTLTRIFIVGGNSEVVWGQSAAERNNRSENELLAGEQRSF
ncbi:hypothetical protein [Virgibacillus halodenitrificans]|uniref:hypothetical protein n=1 Tax=Virgibacillus halodenitrificans TaxID=1482 RepID=UPI002DBCB952|nr:hypothetical protein [Virgibacillus halodenitrificans]MEC2159464.1 hypothetical protein [Virgibacillus halodenitrificans]